MAASRTPSRTSTFASRDSTASSNTASRNAALVGASAAFGRNTAKARAPVNTYAGTNGAFAAASSVGTGSNNPSPRNSISMAPAPQLFPNSTGGSMRSSRDNSGNDMSSPISHLGLPPPSQRGHSKSPSQQAASLAAARAPASTQTSPQNGTAKARAAPSQRPAVAPKPRRLSEHHKRDADNETERPTDSTSIAPTTSLVDLFERKASTSQKAGKRPEPIVIKPAKDLAIKSPKPVRASSGITSVFQMELENKAAATKAPTGDTKPDISGVIESKPSLAASKSSVSTSSNIARSNTVTSSSKREPTITKSLAPEPRPPAKRVPSPSPLRNSTSQAIDIQKPPPRTATAPLEMFPTSPTSMKSIPAQYNYLHPRRMTPSMTGDQLANAMVAGSLASSRAPSPKKMEPPPLPSRRHKHHHTLSFSRTPSPAKSGMRQTLRKTASESSDDEDETMLHPYGKHKKNRLVRKHPNKHHEGDRKRWRDAVTERERKRYEGVWAANKGLYCSFSREEEASLRKIPSQKAQAQEVLQDDVSNIVIRELWSRSRLPESALEMVWDLVDNGNVGRLGKEEFVVGMWLIDQRLKGRKLPAKVGESVWASVKGLQGIKIRK